MPKNHEIDEMLKMEAEALGLKEPLPEFSGF
jgi:hypothetical protein